jgi:hypothetical protein
MPVLIPDVSEFQTVDFRVFSGPIIVRAHNSNRADYHWPQHAEGASKQPWWAAYQYLTATADPTAAAHAFLATLGNYRPNCTILDLEEGGGDLHARQHAWLSVMAGDPARDWTYSGDYFARAHGLDVEWVAAYQQREPTTAHRLWQFSDAHAFPGIGACDASTFDGTVADLVALTNGGSTPAPPSHPSEDDEMLWIVQDTKDGTTGYHAEKWLTNLVTRRHIGDPAREADLLTLHKESGGKLLANDGKTRLLSVDMLADIPVVS